MTPSELWPLVLVSIYLFNSLYNNAWQIYKHPGYKRFAVTLILYLAFIVAVIYVHLSGLWHARLF